MRKIILQGALIFGVGAALGCTLKIQPAEAKCFVGAPCSNNPCCTGVQVPTSTPAVHGVKSTVPIGSCGTLIIPAPGGNCYGADVTYSTTPCGGANSAGC